MFPIPWYVVLLVSIPETYLVVILGFSIFNLKISYKKALLVAVVSSLVCYLIRQFNTINGIQTFIGVTIIIILCSSLTQINLWKVTAAILTSFSFAGVIISLYAPIYFTLTSTTVQNLTINPWLNIYFFFPEAFFMIALYIVTKKFHLGIQNAQMGDTNNETL